MSGAPRTGAPTRGRAIAAATARLAAAGVPAPERDARVLYRWAAGLSGAGLSASLGEPAGAAELARFEAAVAERAARRPVAQIIGEREFWGRPFRVTPDVLDPRPETETLIEAALAGRPARRILDLGTGSGCILLTLLAEWPEAEGTGLDLSAAALAVARENAAALGVARRARLARSEWYEAALGAYDLIVSNPPYLAEAEMAGLDPEVRLHEPREALAAGADGLDAYRAIAAGLAAHLAPGGRVLLETGPTQGRAVAAMLAPRACRIHRDLDGRDRVVEAGA